MGRQTKQPASERSAARREFASRLRALRLPRGFRTARSMARALGIDENRYTRYERAEVEPDLGLIRRICEVLAVTPNDLLGPEAGPGETARTVAVGERMRPEGASLAAAPANGSFASPSGLDLIAWQLSCRVATLRADGGPPPGASWDVHGTPPLAFLHAATGLFAELRQRPFAAIGAIARDPAVQAAGAAAEREINELCLRLADAVAAAASADQG